MSATSTVQRPPAARLTSLDLLRFVAALAVVFYHFVGQTTWVKPWGDGVTADEVFPQASRFAHYGHYGVQLFFAISGFVILMSAQGRTVRQFAASRISRLFPAYWASVILTGVVLAVLSTGSFHAIAVRTVLINTTMLEFGMGVHQVDGVYWTLWVELMFYIIIGILLVRGMTYGRVVALATFWPVAAFLLARAFPELNVVIQPGFAPYFAGGMALYLIYAHGHSWVRWGLVGLNLIMAVAADARAVPTGGASIRGSIIVVLIFAAIAVCTLTPVRDWGGRAGTALGRLTYPLYLFHNMWGLHLIKWLHPVLAPWVTVALALVLALVLAWLINRWVEVPLAPRLRRVVLNGLQTPEPQRTEQPPGTREGGAGTTTATPANSASTPNSPGTPSTPIAS